MLLTAVSTGPVLFRHTERINADGMHVVHESRQIATPIRRPRISLLLPRTRDGTQILALFSRTNVGMNITWKTCSR